VATLALATPFSDGARLVLTALLIGYALACLAASVIVAARHGWRYLAALPVTFMTLHLSHGVGFISALTRFLTPRPAERLRGSLAIDDDERAYAVAAPGQEGIA
jgi:hypothetical protein